MRIIWLGASSSNCSQLGPKLAIPILKFDHPILVALGITALGSILIVPRLFILEIWMEKMMVMHPLGVLPLQILILILMMMHPHGLPSTLITAQGTLIERGSWMSRVSLSWALFIGSPMPSIIPWVREWLQQDVEGIFCKGLPEYT